jgi:hypothetical protein
MSLDVFGVDRLRPLPRPVKPFHNETIGSYLDRLADANRLDREAFRIYIAGDHHKAAPIPLHRLSRLSGQATDVLRDALPDLKSADQQDQASRFRRSPGGRYWVRLACARCTATRGIATQVQCRLRLEDVVCLRHRRWLGRSSYGCSQCALTSQPEILRANRRHRRLLSCHGRNVTEAAYRESDRICEVWRNRRTHDQDFYRLMNIFHTGDWEVPRDDPTVEAAAYPQIIALTRLLVSPDWRERPFGLQTSIKEFEAEVRRTVAPAFTWDTAHHYGHLDPLVEIFLEEARHRADPRPYDWPSPIFTVARSPT